MKMKIRSLFAAALVLSSGAAFAATTDLQVDVQATIPSSTALDVYDVGNWASTPLTMAYNRDTEALAPVTGPLQIKGGVGAVSAYLNNAPMLVSAGDSIDMAVTIGGVALPVGNATVVQVASAADALAGVRKEFQATAAAAPTTGYTAGNYTGLIHMTFDTVAP